MPVWCGFGGMVRARRSGRVRRVPLPGECGSGVVEMVGAGPGSGRGGAADVDLGGDGTSGDVGRGVSERLTALDLSWAVPVPVGGDSGGGDLAQGGVVGCG